MTHPRALTTPLLLAALITAGCGLTPTAADRGPGREPGREAGRDPGREAGREAGRDPGREAGRDPGREQAAAQASTVLVDADAHGAILLDGRRSRIIGVRRDGTVAWRAPLDSSAPMPAGCVAHCPDAVLSATSSSVGSATEPDPEPVFVIGGRRHALPGLPGPKRRVLTATGVDDFVVAVGDPAGRWWLEARHGSEVTRVQVGGFRTSWRESADGRHALALTTAADTTAADTTAADRSAADRSAASTGTGPARNEARWFQRTPAGWRPVGKSTPVGGISSCVRLDGQQAILLGQRPTGLRRNGTQYPVTDLDQAGTCALAPSGGVVAALSWVGGGHRSRLRLFDAGGRVTARADVTAEASVAADPTASRVAYVAQGTLHEIDPRTGSELRRVAGVQAAKYDGAGGLVLARADGTVTWTA